MNLCLSTVNSAGIIIPRKLQAQARNFSQQIAIARPRPKSSVCCRCRDCTGKYFALLIYYYRHKPSLLHSVTLMRHHITPNNTKPINTPIVTLVLLPHSVPLQLFKCCTRDPSSVSAALDTANTASPGASVGPGTGRGEQARLRRLLIEDMVAACRSERNHEVMGVVNGGGWTLGRINVQMRKSLNL